MSTAPTITPTNNKRAAILDTLRQRIVAGEWAPGSRLPTRAELEQEFGVSGFTMQRALDQLNRDGFTYGKRRWGTFVTDNPPHLSRYAIVFFDCPATSPAWMRFWTTLVNEAAKLEQTQMRQLPVFYGVNDHTDSDGYQRLVENVRHRRLAGLIFPARPFPIDGTPAMLDLALPKVSIMSPGESHPNVTPVVLDWRSFFEKALEYMASRGRRRIAVLAAPQQQRRISEYLQQGLAARGLETRPYWLQETSQTWVESAQACVHMLLRGSADERPDGLIIADDNLVEYGAAGAIDAGVQIGQDVDLVAHCNFPSQLPQGLAIKRLGFDARQLLEKSIQIIDRQRRGEIDNGPESVSAVFEDEVVGQYASIV